MPRSLHDLVTWERRDAYVLAKISRNSRSPRGIFDIAVERADFVERGRYYWRVTDISRCRRANGGVSSAGSESDLAQDAKYRQSFCSRRPGERLQKPANSA